MKKIEQLKKYKKIIEAIGKKYGASNIRIFGSVARGEDDENSDIDLLVDLAPGKTIFDLGGLLFELEQLLKTKVDIITYDGLNQNTRYRVLKEVVPL